MPNMRISDIKVCEAMTREFGSVNQDCTLDEILNTMLENQWEEVLVVNDRNELLGLVTREHLMRALSEGASRNLPVAAICRRKVITTTCFEELANARDIMRWHKIGRLPVLDDNGCIAGLLTARDVCNGFSGKLEMMGRHMYAVMENITEAIQVVDCNGVVSFWNDSAEKLFGIKAEDIVGRKLAEYFPNDIILNVIATGEPRRNVLYELRDGVLVIRNAVPVITPDGDTIAAVCTTQNVSTIRSLLEKLDHATSRVRRLESRIKREEETYEHFYTVNRIARRILQQAKRVAQTDATVLIQGESGTGKELLAHVIYRNSKRRQRPFVEVNCSAIPESLFESEMFGYDPGTFTGAKKEGKPGKFELAHGGTLFLDEVGELPLEMQAKLLRVIQERRFYRVGGTTPIEVDVRLLAATNRDLRELVAENKFREDLFYRLNVVTFEIPPLRARKEDIPGLIDRFIKELGCVYEREVTGIDKEALEVFMAYDWPGNVRQLHNTLESVIILMEGDYITVKSLREAGVLDSLVTGIRDRVANTTKAVRTDLADEGLGNLMEKTEKEIILSALEDCGYNKARAAQILGIPRSTLYYKLRTLGIAGITD